MSVTTKQIYLVRGTGDESYRAFKERIHWEAYYLIKSENIPTISYTITEEVPPAFSVIPFKKEKIACISISNQNSSFENNIMKMKGFSGAYLAEEKLPVAYEKTWEDGDKTPGACLLTLFKKKKRLDYETFIDRWHNGHTPLSLKIHPLWHYSRNVIKESSNHTTEQWDGIVEEHTRTRSELLNPFKFFGNALIIVPRMIKVFTDTNSFLAYNSIETYLVAEYHLKG